MLMNSFVLCSFWPAMVAHWLNTHLIFLSFKAQVSEETKGQKHWLFITIKFPWGVDLSLIMEIFVNCHLVDGRLTACYGIITWFTILVV
jgi:hypothetical protein